MQNVPTMHASQDSRSQQKRSSLRQRTGCRTCKHRKVRCNEARPICGHCERLKLDCHYDPPTKRRKTAASPPITITESPPFKPSATSLTGPAGLLSARRAVENFAFPKLCSGTNSQHVAHLDSDGQHPTRESGLCYDAFQVLDLDSGPTYVATGPRDDPNHKDCFLSVDLGGGSLESDAGGPTQPYDTSAWYNNSLTGAPTQSVFQPPATHVDAAKTSTLHCNNNRARRAVQCTGVAPRQYETDETARTAMSIVRNQFNQTRDLRALLESAEPDSDIDGILLIYFKDNVTPPPSLAPIRSAVWQRLQRHLLNMSEVSQAVRNAVLAVAQLFSRRHWSEIHHLGENATCERALRFYHLAYQSLEDASQEADPTTNANHQDALLAALFVLGWFFIEVDTQPEKRLRFPTSTAEKVIRMSTDWLPESELLLKYMNSIDAKATHMGHQAILSWPTFEVLEKYRHTDDNICMEHHHIESETSSALRDDSSLLGGVANNSKSSQQRLPNEDQGKLYLTIALDVVSTVIKTALDFHFTSQTYTRKIASQDRHHRRRNTPDDEFDVALRCKAIEFELMALWQERPPVLDLSRRDLTRFVAPDLAQVIEGLFCVYIATFWAHFLHLHRTAWWNLPLSQTGTAAVDAMWWIMRRSVEASGHGDDGGGVGDAQDTGASTLGDQANGRKKRTLHPLLLWPVFLFGCEACRPDQEEWAVRQLEMMRNDCWESDHQPNATKTPVGPASILLPIEKMSPRTARNTLRLSQLLSELVRRQKLLGARIAGRELAYEVFGCHFFVI